MPRTPRPDSTPLASERAPQPHASSVPYGAPSAVCVFWESRKAPSNNRSTAATKLLQLQAHSRTTTTYPFHEDQSKNISDPVRDFRSVTALPRSPPGPKTIQEASMRPTPPPGIGYGACCSFKSMPVTKQNKTKHGLCGLSHSLLDP